jgi:DNA-binding CsgD family transcriptional regulator
LRCVLDDVEALAALDEVHRAELLLTPFQERAEALGRTWALALGGRAQGILEAASGDLQKAISTLERASVELAPFPIPLEHGRTLLALGSAQLRARRRRDARETLQRALTIFEHLGADLYNERTREELGRIGGRTAAQNALTAAERRVAELVAEGMTNKEVAARLVVSVHTVEASLTSIYRKLGVRSRTEMARKLPAHG